MTVTPHKHIQHHHISQQQSCPTPEDLQGDGRQFKPEVLSDGKVLTLAKTSQEFPCRRSSENLSEL